MRALPTVVGLESRLRPVTWIEVRFDGDPAEIERNLFRIVRRAGYEATRIEHLLARDGSIVRDSDSDATLPPADGEVAPVPGPVPKTVPRSAPL